MTEQETGAEDARRVANLSRRQVLARITMLTGGVLAAPLMSAILSGASSADAKGLDLLSPDEMAFVSDLVETIIPTTDTPGAIAAGVPDYIHLMLARWYKSDERKVILDGFKAIGARARERHGRDFTKLTPAERLTLLQGFDAEAYGSSEGEHFFRQIKSLTVAGYYTSEIGATQELLYDPVPGPFEGCVPFSEIGRPWAIRGI
ncbi:gluconate 2-dehydrogenase subunit 3 family protein [Pseudokordiimonas caeni]|uniref:gluconate 2-dehydrogenase subunit 3 family protein n=1 Tax=Pseudokordiimonas caeni TaxID=2997908 RepID=UPI0028121163|nr:gluconate 2-dehydrogenase subunit 3 family protein [Pseudokordiimonas caeni]